MPHITVQMYPGRSDELKKKLADALVKTAAEVLQREPEHFSASVQDVPKEEWTERVYKSAVDPNNKEVFVRPGY